MSKAMVIGEMFRYLRDHRKLWLAPLIVVLLVFGLLLFLVQGSALAPFIYSIF